MSESVLESGYLYSDLGDDPDLGEIVEMFVDEMPDRISGLTSCLESGDWDELGRLGHQLKGACGSYGFNQMTPHAARLETACRSEQRREDEIREAAANLIGFCSRVRAGAPS